MVDDGWEPIDSGWEPITQDAPAGPLAQLSPVQQIADVGNSALEHASRISQEGLGENLQSFAESTYSQLKAGAKGLGASLLDVGLNPGHLGDLGGVADRAAEVAKKSLADDAKDILQPETAGGKEIQDILALPQKAGAKAGEKTLEATDSPLLATAADLITQNAPFMLGGIKGGVAKLRGAPVDVGLEALRKAAEPIPDPTKPADASAVADTVQAAAEPVAPEKPRFTGAQVARGEHLPPAPDQSGVPNAVYQYVHDMPDSNSGLIDLSNYSPDEQSALRKAGLVKKAELPAYTDEDGEVTPAREHEGVDRSDLIPEREKRYQAEVAAMRASREKNQKTATPVPEPEEPTPAAQRAQRLAELDTKRADLTPDEVKEHAELQYQDRRQGKVGNNGAPMEGVGNAVALAENHDVQNALQVHTDIDNFKALNDTAGHPAGDTLIQHVGETLALEFPPDETGKPSVYHHGGDEFTIVPKPGETLADVHKRVEDVREQVKNTPIELTDAEGNTSVHPGVDFSLGAGEGHGKASASLASDKAAREASGVRRPRYNRSTDTPGTVEGAADSVAARAERPASQVDERTAVASSSNLDNARADKASDSSSKAVPDTTGNNQRAQVLPDGTQVRNTAEAVDPLPEVSARNAAIDESRARMGLEPMAPAERKGWDATREEAAKIVKADPNAAAKIIAEHKATERPLTDAEQVVLAEHASGIEKKWGEADAALSAAKKSGDGIAAIRAEADRHYYEVKAHEAHGALSIGGGTANARSLGIRRMIITDRYTIGRNMERAEASYGHLTDRLRNEARQYSQDIAKAKAELEDLQNKQEKARTENTKRQSKPRTKMTDEEREHAKVERQVADKLKRIQELKAQVEKRLKACPI